MDFDSLVTEVVDRIQCMELDVLAKRYLPALHQPVKAVPNSTGAATKCLKGLTIAAGKKRKNETQHGTSTEAAASSRTVPKTMPAKKGRKVHSSVLTQSLPAMTEESGIKLPGTWVECCLCRSWRYLPAVHDPSELPVNWYCALHFDPTSEQGRLVDPDPTGDVGQACRLWPSATESDNPPGPAAGLDSFIYAQFAVGSLVWAKVQGYPYWPAMVYYNAEGRYAEFDATTQEASHYYVVFLDPVKATVGRVAAGKLRKFTSLSDGVSLQSGTGCYSLRVKRHYGKLRAAAEVAEEAMKLSIQERIATYGYDYEAKVSTKKRRALATIGVDTSSLATSALVPPPSLTSHSLCISVQTGQGNQSVSQRRALATIGVDTSSLATSALVPPPSLTSHSPCISLEAGQGNQSASQSSEVLSLCLEEERKTARVCDGPITGLQAESIRPSPTSPASAENMRCGQVFPDADLSPPDSPSFLRPSSPLDDSLIPFANYQSPYPPAQSPGCEWASGRDGSGAEDSSANRCGLASSLSAVGSAYFQRALDDFASFSLYPSPGASVRKLERPVVPWSVACIPFHLQLT